MHRFLGLVPICLLFASVASAQVILERDTCSQVFGNSRQENIDCQAGFRLDPAQRNKLEQASYGMLSDLACSAHITGSRSDILRRAKAGGNVHLPPQTVHCRLLAQGQPFTIHFHMAPMVRVDKGRAVDAALGITKVTGIPEPAATLVAEVLNNEPNLRRSLVAAANDILPNLPQK
jgi:hypothetical protein